MSVTVPVLEVFKFRSPHRGLRVVRRSEQARMNNEGRMVTTAPEVAYEFQIGWLEVQPGQDMLPDAPPFDNMTGEGELQDAASWLRAFAATGQPLEEVLPLVPDSGPVLLELAEAQLAGDLDAINRIGDEEAVTWQRPDVLARAGVAFNALQPPKAKT